MGIMDKLYVNKNGDYLGVYSNKPKGGVAVSKYPTDARQKWDGKKWLPLDEKYVAIQKIQDLEELLTPRRLRESARNKTPIIVDGVDILKEIERLEVEVLAR